MIVNLIHLTQNSVNYLSAAVEKRQSDVKILFLNVVVGLDFLSVNVDGV